MDRCEFHKLFKCVGPAVLPVIHVLDLEQTRRNVRVALQEGAPGVMLINHDFPVGLLLPVIKQVRAEFPWLWMGVNFLGVTGDKAFPILGQLAQEGTQVDGYWADNALIDEHADRDGQISAKRIAEARQSSGWKGLYFGGTAFKLQRAVADDSVGRAASLAVHYMDVVTTSGSATGIAARTQKIVDMREGCGEAAIALASGVTPSNAGTFLPYVDCFMVATGISSPGDFYNFNPLLLRRLIKVTQNQAMPELQSPLSSTPAHTDAWYLSLIAPNTKGEKFAWLDPSSIYINHKAFSDLTNDLLSHFNPREFDLVAGIDGMGFPLAATMATRTGKGFLVVRKGGRLCVDTEEVSHTCYSGSGKVLELRKNAFQPGTRVLLVDQWIETGGTMTAAVELVERQHGIVAGIAVICVEGSPQGKELCRKYKVAHVISPSLQPLFDNHSFLGTMMK